MKRTRNLIIMGLFLGACFSPIGSFAIPIPSGVAVADWSNYFSNLEQINQTIEQHKIRVAMYDEMMRNGKTLSKFEWDDANSTITSLLQEIDTLKAYKEQAGGMDAYLNQQQDLDEYRKMACFNQGRCSQTDLDALYTREAKTVAAQKRTNQARIKGIDKQQKSLSADAKTLRTLQSNAQKADGQMQALQSANQLASSEVNQLLQIRGLMISQQNAEAARMASVANKEAMQAAGDAQLRRGDFKRSSGRQW